MRASKRGISRLRRAAVAFVALSAVGTVGTVGTVGCGAGKMATPPPPVLPAPPQSLPEPIPRASVEDVSDHAGEHASASPPDPEDAGARLSSTAACPANMALVDTTYCPRPVLRCLKSEYDKANHITICHRFAPGQGCATKLRRQRYCIDRYEYPNREGAHPPVMVSWYDGAAACAAEGKRLCWQSEWESACEGPDRLPFPYGLARDSEQCNIDNAYVKPNLERVYSPRADVQGSELLKLDQSVASGARPGCTSGFGVHDLTGNVDEWVNSEEDKGKSRWAGLKGGAWGHVRNACRPMTTSHPPEFTYYFISFRCCADAAPDADAAKDPALWTPPPMPDHAPPGGKVSAGWTTSARGPNRPR